ICIDRGSGDTRIRTKKVQTRGLVRRLGRRVSAAMVSRRVLPEKGFAGDDNRILEQGFRGQRRKRDFGKDRVSGNFKLMEALNEIAASHSTAWKPQ
ncbi:hypothetical protein U1Q18_005141, partial [Sarracenia purpurea var. burkii]